MKKYFLASIFFLFSTTFAATELTIQVTPTMPSVIPLNAVNLPMLNIHLTATNGPVSIEKLVFQRTGLSSSKDIKSIRSTNETGRSRSFSMLYDDTASITFFRGLTLAEGETQTLSITANLDVQGLGRTVGLELIDITCSTPLVTLNDVSIEMPRLATDTSPISDTDLSVQKLNFTPSRLRLGYWQKLETFLVSNTDNADANLKALYIQHQGTGNLPEIFETLLLTSSNQVISNEGALSSRSARFSFFKNSTIPAYSDRKIEIWGKIRRNKSTYSVNFKFEGDDFVVQ